MAVPSLQRRPHAASRVIPGRVREFGSTVWNANVTGLSSMLAYNMLLGVVPLALLGLFITGQVLKSGNAEHSVEHALQVLFPGTTKHTLDTLLNQVAHATATTGILALVASLWLASSFWGSLDTAFSRIYGIKSRPWLAQKRFGFVMVLVMVLFLIATVAVPTLQSFLKAGVGHLPSFLHHVHGIIYIVSLAFSLGVVFACLATIYARVPNQKIPWHAVWPGALAATVAIGIIDYAFPLYLNSVSTIARYDSVIVFIVICLGWFYVVSLVILLGAVMNSVALAHHSPRRARHSA
jgi:membrane protein